MLHMAMLLQLIFSPTDCSGGQIYPLSTPRVAPVDVLERSSRGQEGFQCESFQTVHGSVLIPPRVLSVYIFHV